MCATTYENVSTSVNQYSTKDETAARIARLALQRGVQSHGDASLSRSRSRERVGGNLGNEVGSVPSEVGGTKLSVFFNSALQRLTKRHLFLSLLYEFHSDFIVFTSPTVTGKCDLVPARGCDHHLLNVESFTGGTRQVLTHLDIYNLYNQRKGRIVIYGRSARNGLCREKNWNAQSKRRTVKGLEGNSLAILCHKDYDDLGSASERRFQA